MSVTHIDSAMIGGNPQRPFHHLLKFHHLCTTEGSDSVFLWYCQRDYQMMTVPSIHFLCRRQEVDYRLTRERRRYFWQVTQQLPNNIILKNPVQAPKRYAFVAESMARFPWIYGCYDLKSFYFCCVYRLVKIGESLSDQATGSGRNGR